MTPVAAGVVTKIPIAAPWVGEEEVEAAARPIRSGWLTQGPEVAAFEREFAAYVGARHACAVSNCTTALHLALRAVGVGPGDEVITVSHSFIATANAIRYCDAVPVFIDIDEDRRRAAVANRVGRRDERVADRDDLIAGADAGRQQSQVERRRAVRHRAGVRRADELGELTLERRDLGPLRDPAGKNHPAHRLDLDLVENGSGDRNLRNGV